jgi:Bacterial cellulose synthase subunit
LGIMGYDNIWHIAVMTIMSLISNIILLLFRAVDSIVVAKFGVTLVYCVFVCAFCALPCAAWAMAVALPLTAQDLQIKGLTAQATFSISVDAKKERKTDPVLHLVWRKSRLIDVQRSTLSVVVDGNVRRTAWLADLGDGKYAVPLTGLAGGVHTLVLRASLRVDDDPCLQQYRDDAWFTIKSESTVAWERREQTPKQVLALPLSPINRYPDVWQRLADGWSGVHLNMPSTSRTLDAGQASAYLEAHHLIRRWAYLAQRQATSRTVGSFHLLTLADLTFKADGTAHINSDAHQMIVRRFAQTPAATYFITSDAQGGLSVVGRDTEGLRDGIAILANDSARTLCNDSVCEGGSASVYPATPIKATHSVNTEQPDASRVWSLRQANYANGWLARGEGTHVLAFNWQRPATWKIAAWPMLHLHGQASNASTVDASNSMVTVRLNGRPLASYPLSQWQHQRSEVRIPSELWDAPQWAFEIAVTLKATQSKKCVGAEEDSLWFTIGTNTQLLVPRQEQSFDSVGKFYSDAISQGNLPALYAPIFELDALESLAPVLYPFYQAQLKPESPSTKHNLRWQWVSANMCQTRRCIQLLSQSREGALLRIEGDHWQPNGLNLPHISTAGTVAVFYQADSAVQSAQLYVVPGPLPNVQNDESVASGGRLEPPDYTGLLGRIALFSKRWLPLDIQPMTAQGSLIGKPNLKDNPLDENTASKEQIALRWLNFVWASISVLVLAGVFFKLWRKPKNKTIDENWEIHDK